MRSVKKMTEALATEILAWQYEKPYDLYNNENNESEREEMLDGSYFAILEEERTLIGFLCVGRSAQVPKGHEFGAYSDGFVDIGLGMKPVLTGSGHGYEFCSFILNYINGNLNSESLPFRLTVATFNQRAIHLYERLGFVRQAAFDSGPTAFITMVKN